MFEIVSLRDRPEYTDTCAAWSFGEWGCMIEDGRKLEDVIKGYRQSTISNDLPQGWICLCRNKMVGTIRLKLNDHPDRPDLNPWLASLFVHPRFRGKDIAQALCRRVEKEARDQFNVKTLYLYTADAEKLYARLGWKKIGTVRDSMGLHPDGEILMQKDLG